jgi:aminoglycoside phosphotransferase (APT) family kinase protein
MTTPWTPEIEIDDEIAKRLLRNRFPELELLNLNLLGSGWDNQAYLINNSLVFRFPHRKMGGELMDLECTVLEYLSRYRFPLQVPEPKFVAKPDNEFPYTIAGYQMILGKTADSETWAVEERAANAEPLGSFLSALHKVPTDVPFAFGDLLRRADISFRIEKIRQQLANAPAGFLALAEELALKPLLSTPPVWVHGDLYSRHLVVDSSKTVCGIIDWGDTHVGDPALDIAIAWMFLPPSSWPTFIEAYGGVDPDTWKRAQFRAMTHWVYLSRYAEERDEKHLLRELEFVLGNVMERAIDD